MATRKLKFKPKPVVGGAVRRPREKEEVPELSSQESPHSQEPSCQNIRPTLHNDIQRDQKLTSNEHDFSEGSVLKRMRVELTENTVIAPSTDISGESCEITRSLVSVLSVGTINQSTTDITNNKQLDSIVADKKLSLESLSTQGSESSTTASIAPSCSQASSTQGSESSTTASIAPSCSQALSTQGSESSTTASIAPSCTQALSTQGSESSMTASIAPSCSQALSTQGSESSTTASIAPSCTQALSTQGSESSMKASIAPSCSQETTEAKESRGENSSLDTISGSQTSDLSQESCVNVKPTDKTEATKVMPRLGRSKFKPVLSNSVSRKKIEVSCNSTVNNTSDKSEINSISTIRTESVIKCVKSETTTPSIVSEITESFSALESEEPDLPIMSPPKTKENQTSGNFSRFEFGDKNVKASMNEFVPSNKTDLVNTSNLVESVSKLDRPNLNISLSKVSDLTGTSQLNQTLEKLQNRETSSMNVLTSSAPKVPVSPLKLSSKILVPKPSPNLLDTTVRRISFQGSDSEEESKRKILKNNKLGKKIKEEKDVKNSKRKLSQGSTYSKLGQEALEKFTQKFGKIGKLEPRDKAKLTMLDLIFYNPKSNPMSVSTEQTSGVRKKEEKIEVNGVVKEVLAEQAVDDVEEVGATPVPQLKVGPDGQIMLDPNSLVIETTEVKEKRAEMEKSEVIRETGITRYNTYSKKKHARKEWTHQETLQFYKALNTIGSDFTLMTKLFPKRSRHELKLKFKKEEKINMKLVDKAMTAPTDFDFSSLEEEMRQENEEIARLEEEKRMAAEAAKKAKAQRKEEKEKAKEYPRGMKPSYGAFNSFDEAETERIMKHQRPKKKRVVKRKRKADMLVVSSSDDEPVCIDLDSDEAELDESDKKLLKMIRDKSRAGKRRGPKPKQTKKLEEYEEINETLKRKLEEIDSELSDGYTPNGPGADMLFGSPMRDPFPEEEGSQWSMEVAAASSVENTVFMTNVEDSSKMSKLSCFGRNENSLETTQDTNPVSDPAGSVLGRHLISESIQIIDQLTSNEQLNVNSENITSDKRVENEDLSGSSSQQSENQILPQSFVPVNLCMPTVYTLAEQCNPVENSAKPCGEDNTSTVSKESDKDVCDIKDNNQEESVLSYYGGNNSEECILGD